MRPENQSKLINYLNIPIYHDDLRTSFSELLSWWDWQAHIILSYNHSVDSRSAIKEAKQLLKACRSKFRKMRCAGILLYAISPGGNTHIHILLTSDQRYPQTIGNHNWGSIKSPTKWLEFYWRDWEKGTCKITSGWRQDVICKYLSEPKNFPTWDSDRYEIDYFRLNLLMQLKGDKKLVIVSEKY
jgi:hypothetical protein